MRDLKKYMCHMYNNDGSLKKELYFSTVYTMYQHHINNYNPDIGGLNNTYFIDGNYAMLSRDINGIHYYTHTIEGIKKFYL